MILTTSPAWTSLQALQSRLSGKLARFTRSTNLSPRDSAAQKAQNEAAFLEADLRYIFTTIPAVLKVPDQNYVELETRTQQLLTTLDDNVNRDFVEALQALTKQGPESHNDPSSHPKTNSHDLTSLGVEFPRLSAMLDLLENSTTQFNLTASQGPSTCTIFLLPNGDTGDVVLNHVGQMKEFLMSLVCNAEEHQPSQLHPLQSVPAQPQALPERYASALVGTLIREMQQHSCESLHEMKLKVSDEWQVGAHKPPLDMFLSCCIEQTGWHQAQCGAFDIIVDEAQKDGVCAAIRRARKQGRSIYLSIDSEQLFDVSDTMPTSVPTTAHLMTETLDKLLDQKALTRITPGDYRRGTVGDKFSSREKAILALALARCLMEFVDNEVELASHSWKPESVYFLRSSRGPGRDRVLYLSLKPASPGYRSCQTMGALGPGNPILLSFAKLLLEIDNGERLTMDIYPDSRANLPTWGEMCDIVERIEREGGGNYLRAVEGCLYLHMSLRKSQTQAGMTPGDALRKTIYEQIVRNLEDNANPQSSKRKRRDSVSELPLGKKLSLNTLPVGSIHNRQSPPSSNNRPDSRNDFEIAIVCALPLEFDAVSALVDEFWHGDYGRVKGDTNIYTNARLGKFNVVLLLLPNMGKVRAASSSANLRLSYPELSLVLVTGICGGVPFPDNRQELLLGDVVISRHVIQYDHGRKYPSGYETKSTVEDRLGRAPPSVRSLLTMLQTDMMRERLQLSTTGYLEAIQTESTRKSRGLKYKYPGTSQDWLFEADYQHERHTSQAVPLKANCAPLPSYIESYGVSCADLGCDSKQAVRRARLERKKQLESQMRLKDAQAPCIFLGTIGSGDTVIKSGEERDRLASKHKLIAFEMEGAGVWDELPCIIVKAVCDYADSHKNKSWQNFAAATAASAAKALLDCYTQRDRP
ncbi:hypothetical protein BJX99DRAFT_230848 [Aspergillus californicus]